MINLYVGDAEAYAMMLRALPLIQLGDRVILQRHAALADAVGQEFIGADTIIPYALAGHKHGGLADESPVKPGLSELKVERCCGTQGATLPFDRGARLVDWAPARRTLDTTGTAYDQ